ncbi:hypothetical protein PR003_g15638 [Phytophthora rubi]|uniref:Uncharacterized protein n=1 Tax=Phytophthora rubi TaxID=129364 RepID=A0A6A4EWI9_9STRA|nr:hypothetical protein PR002_g15474 [Phytophthora rubi]KAE9015572.1 hypothetical protein PR001_g14865 [Phytophthora rubi]KAE9329082.1 hypothetical protein PR003_g15638 [Phytophthora rubi]
MQSYDVATDTAAFQKQSEEYRNGLIVLHAFYIPIENSNPSLGAIVSSRRLFRNAKLCIDGQERDGVMVATDGTYKLHKGGWTLVDFGTYEAYYTRNDFAHRFVPIAYTFVQSESIQAYDRPFSDRVYQFFGVRLEVKFGSLDHASCIATAFQMSWPEVQL